MKKVKLKTDNDEKIFYYDDPTEDFIETNMQNYELPKEYEYMPKSKFFKFKSAVLYFVAKIIVRFICKFYLHVKIKNRKAIKSIKKTGYFMYGNHTNPLSDAFSPAIIANTRIYTICSPANFGIPIIGNILPELGGIPLGKTLDQKKKFRQAIDAVINKNKCIVIYPEAHLWPYYNGLRDFSNKSFKYPVDLKVPVFSFTTTYQKRKIGKRPRITIYIDGPFYINDEYDIEQNREKLKQDVYKAMEKRIKNTTYEYYKYLPKSKKGKDDKNE